MADRLPAQITIYVKDGGDWRLKPYVDREILTHPRYLQVLREGGHLIFRDAEAVDGNPIPGQAREGELSGIPRDVDYDWTMRGSRTRDSMVGWRREGEMTVYRATLAGEPMVTRAELGELVSTGDGARPALESLTKPLPTYPVGGQGLETDWEGTVRAEGRAQVLSARQIQ